MLVKGIDLAGHRLSYKRSGSHFEEALKERLDSEVVECRSEEYGRKLAATNFINVKIKACSVDKIDLLTKLVGKIASDNSVKLFSVIYITFYGA